MPTLGKNKLISMAEMLLNVCIHIPKISLWIYWNCNYDHTFILQNTAELQIIFEPNAYLPPTFWLNADFQNFKWYFHPLYFFAMLKREVLLFLAYIMQFCVVLDISFVVICFCLWYYIANACFCHNTCCNEKEAIDNMLANGQTDGPLQSRVLLLF